MARQRTRVNAGKQRTNRARSALKVFMALVFLGVGGSLFLLRSGSEVQTGSPRSDGSLIARKEMRPTRSPAMFVGKVARAHEVAQRIPGVLDHLYCYCECDKHKGHKSLLSCYTDGHAATCNICMDEALDASRLYDQGKDVGEIRTQIDRQYGRL